MAPRRRGAGLGVGRDQPRSTRPLLVRLAGCDRSVRPSDDRGPHDEHLRARGVPPPLRHLACVPCHDRRRRRRRVPPRARGVAVDHALRRERLGGRLSELGLDALFVTRLPNVRYLTGFTGSNAQVLVGAEAAVFFTDGRYREQSRHEVPDAERVIYAGPVPPLADEAAARTMTRIGFESEDVTFGSWERLRRTLEGIELVPTAPEVERLRRVKDPEEV